MKKIKILLVDDEQDFLKITKLNLEDTGRFEVMAIANVKDLIPSIQRSEPDIILLDLLMPEQENL